MKRGEGFGLAGLIGWPVAQSRSPAIHNYWMERYGLEGRYVLLPVAPGRLEAALRGLPALGFRGGNVTMPYKRAVMPLLDAVDATARRVGAVNTITVLADGTLLGTNTDAAGYLASLREAAPGWRGDAGPSVVLGAGGAARAVVAALIEAGAREIRVLNRTAAHAERLAELGGPVAVFDWANRADVLADAALLTNATSLGMTGKPALELSLGRLAPGALVSDLVYAPVETPLLAGARARGNPVVGGLGMLLHQAVPAFEAWFGVRPEVTPELHRAVLATF